MYLVSSTRRRGSTFPGTVQTHRMPYLATSPWASRLPRLLPRPCTLHAHSCGPPKLPVQYSTVTGTIVFTRLRPRVGRGACDALGRATCRSEREEVRQRGGMSTLSSQPTHALSASESAGDVTHFHAAILTTRTNLSAMVVSQLQQALPATTLLRVHEAKACTGYRDNGIVADRASMCVKQASWVNAQDMFRVALAHFKAPLLRFEDDACLAPSLPALAARSIIVEGVNFMHRSTNVDLALLGSFRAVMGKQLSTHYHELSPISGRQPGNRGWHAVLFSTRFMEKYTNRSFADFCHWPAEKEAAMLRMPARDLHTRGFEVDIDSCVAKFGIGKEFRGATRCFPFSMLECTTC